MSTAHLQPSSYMKRSRLAILLAIIIIASAAVLFICTRPAPGYSLELRTYFQDAHGVREGASVRLAGVEVGRVKAVRARPELEDHPAEVIFSLRTPYELSIPADATVFLDTAGVWGETFAEIDVRNTSNVPIKNGGVLKSMPSPAFNWEQVIERMADCKAGSLRDGVTAEPSATNGGRKSAPPMSKPR